jgi:hypothetical protein
MSGEVWQEVYDRLTRLIEGHRTTLVFVNTRSPKRLGFCGRRVVDHIQNNGFRCRAQPTESRVKPPWSASTSVTATGGEKDRDALKASSTRRKARTSSVP